MELRRLYLKTALFVIGHGKSLAVLMFASTNQNITTSTDFRPCSGSWLSESLSICVQTNSGIFIGTRTEICCKWMTVNRSDSSSGHECYRTQVVTCLPLRTFVPEF
jgi:hypothetical protein